MKLKPFGIMAVSNALDSQKWVEFFHYSKETFINHVAKFNSTNFWPFLAISKNKSAETIWILLCLFKFKYLGILRPFRCTFLHLRNVSHGFRQNIAYIRIFFDYFEPISENVAVDLVRGTTCSFSVLPNAAHSRLSSGKIKAQKFK